MPRFNVSQSPPKLLDILQSILEDLGIEPQGAAGGRGGMGAKGYGNGTLPGNDTDPGQGEVSATPQLFDVEYLVPVQIGTPVKPPKLP